MTNDQASDQRIIQLVLNGDYNAYADIMSRYESKLIRYVLYIVRDEALAADIVQDTFIKAYQNLRGYKSEYKFSSWIYRIAHNETMNAIKKHKRTINQADLSDVKELFYEDSNLQAGVDRNLLKRDVRRCMELLPPKHKEVLLLHYFENMKYAEISDILHMPVSSVGVNIKRAKDSLREICKKQAITYEQ